MKNKMKLFLGITLLSFISCGTSLKTEPIEKYGSSKYVITNKSFWNGCTDLQLKNPDTIFCVKVLDFDDEKLDVGDTIK